MYINVYMYVCVYIYTCIYIYCRCPNKKLGLLTPSPMLFSASHYNN